MSSPSLKFMLIVGIFLHLDEDGQVTDAMRSGQISCVGRHRAMPCWKTQHSTANCRCGHWSAAVNDTASDPIRHEFSMSPIPIVSWNWKNKLYAKRRRGEAAEWRRRRLGFGENFRKFNQPSRVFKSLSSESWISALSNRTDRYINCEGNVENFKFGKNIKLVPDLLM